MRAVSSRLGMMGLIVVGSTFAWCQSVPPSGGTGPAKGQYRLTKTLPIGGEGRWDYVIVNPAARQLLVPRSTHVQVINLDSGKVMGDLKDTPGVHGVALAPDLGRGFTSNGQAGTVTVFDLRTLQVIGIVKAGKNPDAIIYDPFSRKVFAFNGRSNDATVINAASPDAPTARIELDGKPEFAGTDGRGHVYVNIEDKSEVAKIDVASLKVVNTWKIEGGEEPSGLAVDAANHRVYSGCHNKVMAVLDTETGKTLGTIPIGSGVDACAFDPGAGTAFASCGDGTMTIAKETAPGKFDVIQVVQTRRGARTMALDSNTHKAYLPTADFEPGAGGGRPAMKPGSFQILVVSMTTR
jgi:DNA-binding beta-propeller fold protein YncE